MEHIKSLWDIYKEKCAYNGNETPHGFYDFRLPDWTTPIDAFTNCKYKQYS